MRSLRFQSSLTRTLLISVLATNVLANASRAQVANFDDVDFDVAPDSAWVGPTENSQIEVDAFGGDVSIGTFSSGGASFLNQANQWGLAKGFAVSNRVDTTTVGFTSGTSAITGTGFDVGNDNYATVFGYVDQLDHTNVDELQQLPYFDPPADMDVVSAHVTNTTYSALSMQFGDAFAKQFGGTSGGDPDYFRLSIFGSLDGTALSDVVEFYLADFRADESTNDTIVNQWTFVDLTPLADADRLYFNLDSSDNGTFGMNTPAYFAIDNIQFESATNVDVLGDVNRDGVVSIADVDAICGALSTSDLTYDVDQDGTLSLSDVDAWLNVTGNVTGDTDLNGEVAFADFLHLSANFESESSFWSRGDFDCDGDVAFADFLLLSQNFGRTSGKVANVPEPSDESMVFVLGLAALALRRRYLL